MLEFQLMGWNQAGLRGDSGNSLHTHHVVADLPAELVAPRHRCRKTETGREGRLHSGLMLVGVHVEGLEALGSREQAGGPKGTLVAEDETRAQSAIGRYQRLAIQPEHRSGGQDDRRRGLLRSLNRLT